MASFFGRRAPPPKPTVSQAEVQKTLDDLEGQIDANERRYVSDDDAGAGARVRQLCCMSGVDLYM